MHLPGTGSPRREPSQKRWRSRCHELAGVTLALSFAVLALAGCHRGEEQIASLIPPAPVAPPQLLASAPPLPPLPASYAPNGDRSGRLGDRDVAYLRWLGQYELQRRQFDTASRQRLNQLLRSFARPVAPTDTATRISDLRAIVDSYGALGRQFAQTAPPTLCQPVAARYADYLRAVALDTQHATDPFTKTQGTAATGEAPMPTAGAPTPPLSGAAATTFNNTIAIFSQQHPELPPDIAGIRVPPPGTDGSGR